MTSQEYLRALYTKVFGQTPPGSWWAENGMSQPPENQVKTLLDQADATLNQAARTLNPYIETIARNQLMDSCSSEQLTRFWYLKKKFSQEETR